jgi:acyl-coenzyme A synthetase/AMP-(fatty) acid ligase
MAAYKVPVEIAFIEELPKSATGKILKRVLRDQETPSG